MVQGIMPGPELMTKYADVTYTLIWAVLLANVALFLVGMLFTISINVTRVPNKVIAPIIIVLCVIGAYSISNSMIDVILMFSFGILGFFMDKIKMPTAPMVVGLILGHMLDVSLHQSLLISQGSWLSLYKIQFQRFFSWPFYQYFRILQSLDGSVICLKRTPHPCKNKLKTDELMQFGVAFATRQR